MPLFDSSVAAFAAIAVVITMTPGADTMLIVRNTLHGGRSGGLLSTAGVMAGGFVHASAAALGLSAILLRSTELYSIVKFLGAVYLVYLGIQSIRTGLQRRSGQTSERTPETSSSWQPLGQGFVTNALNPKVALFYVAFLPQFIRPSDPVVAKTFLLVGIHYAMALLWLTGITLFVHRASALFRSSSFKRNLDLAAGAIFVGLGARLALSRR